MSDGDRVFSALVWIEALIGEVFLLTCLYLLDFLDALEDVNGSLLIFQTHLLHLFKYHLLCIVVLILLYVHKLGFERTASTVGSIYTGGES